jgi:hypothetical protein
MIWSNRSYNARKGKIILGRGLDGMPLIKLNAPKGAKIHEGINYEYTIKEAEETNYIKKERDNKMFLLLNFEEDIDTGIANIYTAEINEYDIEMLEHEKGFGVNFNLQKVVLIKIKYSWPILFKIEYSNESIDDQYISVISKKVYCLKSNRRNVIEEINWIKLY